MGYDRILGRGKRVSKCIVWKVLIEWVGGMLVGGEFLGEESVVCL